jgi:valine--pyruvate aminotransferase
MKIQLSNFGQKLTAQTGILELMDDLGKAMSGQDKILMLGGGNPAHIPEVKSVLREEMKKLLASKKGFEDMVGNYNTSQGNINFIRILVNFFNRHYNWKLTEQNIAITNGSQNAFFYLFNILAGKCPNGKTKKILFPLSPEYIGYEDQGIFKNLFISFKPKIEILEKHEFKYFVDFGKIKIDRNIAAICVSRPTNPTGNIITDQEVKKLDRLAKKHNIPLIIDNAYGLPFPNIVFNKATPIWNKNIILSMSLSKLGMPGARTGIIIADKAYIKAISSINAIVNLSSNNLGQNLASDLFKSDKVIELSNKFIKPYYQNKAQHAIKCFKENIKDEIPYYIHKLEGSIFLWVWFKNLPISSKQLYNELKKKNVIIVPGNYFFPGLKNKWKHRHECIRVSYAQNEKIVEKGVKIIGDLINNLYKQEA